MDHQNRVAAVVVTYNRKELLRQNLAALLNQEDYSTDIIIVDNASSDGTADIISKEFNVSQVVYKNTGANLGGAGGCQYGVREAKYSGVYLIGNALGCSYYGAPKTSNVGVPWARLYRREFCIANELTFPSDYCD